MSCDEPNPTVANPWTHLAALTPARIALGRSGISIPTRASLAFNAAHAAARNAVHQKLDTAALISELQCMSVAILAVRSAAATREIYLQRPDLGRTLDAASARIVDAARSRPADVAFVVADGLSALAIERNAPALLTRMYELANRNGWRLAPLVVAEQARVALGDEIGERLGAKIVVVLIGERPGLSSPDSLGVYLTFDPHVGRSDAERNCISNVRHEGLSAEAATHKLAYLIGEALACGYSGVALKDRSDSVSIEAGSGNSNFLIES